MGSVDATNQSCLATLVLSFDIKDHSEQHLLSAFRFGEPLVCWMELEDIQLSEIVHFLFDCFSPFVVACFSVKLQCFLNCVWDLDAKFLSVA